MKKLLLTLSMLLVCQLFYSQESKLKLESFSITFGNYEPEKGNNQHSEPYTDFFLSANYNNNLFAISYDGTINWLFSFYGEEHNRKNSQISISYGRRLNIYKWIKFEAYTGFGYFQEKYKTETYVTWENEFSFIKDRPDSSVEKIALNSISFPVKLRLVLDYSKRHSAGINYSYNFNSISNYKSIGLVFAYKF